MRSIKKIICSGVFLMGMIILLSSCLKDNDPVVTGPLTYQVINAAPGSVEQDFYVSNKKANVAPIAFAAPAVQITGISGYSNVTFANAGSSIGNATLDVFLTPNTVFNIFYASIPDGQVRIFGYQNDQNKSASNRIKVRFLHLAANIGGSIDISNAAGSVASDVQFAREYSYIELDAGSSLNATVNGSLQPVSIDGGSLSGGNNYTIWFSWDASGDVNYHIIKDNLN